MLSSGAIPYVNESSKKPNEPTEDGDIDLQADGHDGLYRIKMQEICAKTWIRF